MLYKLNTMVFFYYYLKGAVFQIRLHQTLRAPMGRWQIEEMRAPRRNEY